MNRIVIDLDDRSDGATVRVAARVGRASVAIELPRAYVRTALAALRGRIGPVLAGEEDDGCDEVLVAGFFDDIGRGLKKAAKTIGKVADLPLVRAAISAIPYAGTALAVADVARGVIATTQRATAKVAAAPKGKAIVALVDGVRRGDPEARRVAIEMRRRRTPEFAQARALAALYRDRDRALVVLQPADDTY